MAQTARGPIPPLPPITARAETVVQARANCAARARDRGEHEGAAAYERGEQDLGWGLRHEINKLYAEAAVSGAQALEVAACAATAIILGTDQ